MFWPFSLVLVYPAGKAVIVVQCEGTQGINELTACDVMCCLTICLCTGVLIQALHIVAVNIT